MKIKLSLLSLFVLIGCIAVCLSIFARYSERVSLSFWSSDYPNSATKFDALLEGADFTVERFSGEVLVARKPTRDGGMVEFQFVERGDRIGVRGTWQGELAGLSAVGIDRHRKKCEALRMEFAPLLSRLFQPTKK